MSTSGSWISDSGDGHWHRTGDALVEPALTMCGRTVDIVEAQEERPAGGTFCQACEESL